MDSQMKKAKSRIYTKIVKTESKPCWHCGQARWKHYNLMNHPFIASLKTLRRFEQGTYVSRQERRDRDKAIGN